MISQSIKRAISLSLIVMLMIFFTYQSVVNRSPFNETLRSLSTLQILQMQLHRDILRYRNGKIRQYDTINSLATSLSSASDILLYTVDADDTPGIHQQIINTKDALLKQHELIEDFKTHNSIIQNSLSYFSREHELAINNAERQYISTTQAISKLSIYLLEYTRNPSSQLANKVYPILDKLNIDANTDIHSLINHSLIIIEKLPEIEAIISKIGALQIDEKLFKLHADIKKLENELAHKSRIFNALLLICSLYIIIYLGLVFIALKRNKGELARINQQLNTEVNDRAKTEKTLSMLLTQNPSNTSDDHIYNILHAICDSLGVRYAYISYISADNPEYAVMAGLMDNQSYKKNIRYQIDGSPCDDVLRQGRLVCNRDFGIQYFHTKEFPISNATSYIGVALKDDEMNVKGLIAIANDEPIENTNLYESIITITASRAHSELMRQIEQQNSSRYQDGLSLIDKWVNILIASASNKNEFFKNTCLAAQEITGATLVALPVLDHSRKNYTYSEATGDQSEKLKHLEMPMDDGGICAWSMQNAKNLLIEDLKYDLRAKKSLANTFDIKSALITPVKLNDEVYGAIAAFKSDTSFDETDEQLITQLSKNIQMALANMQLVSDIETEKERAQITLHSIGDAVITTNREGNIEYMNKIAEQLTGCSFTSSKNSSIKNVFDIVDTDTDESMTNLIDTCLDEDISISKSIVTLLAKDNLEREIECSISPILSSESLTGGVVIIFHDETERHRLEHIVKHQSSHDALTGLLNRDEFNKKLTDQLFDSINLGLEHSMCYIDIDNFHEINDTSGHTAGDELLKHISIILNRCTRNGDLIGRIGGDEFGIILDKCTTENAIHITEKINEEINNQAFIWDENQYSISASIGITQITPQSQHSSEIITQADVACQTAKDYGKNRIFVYEQKNHSAVRKREEEHWASRISEAIKKQQFRLYAQPIASLKTSSCKQVEVLLRLEDETENFILPKAFIPAAERYNLMAGVDKLVIENTFKFIHESVNNKTKEIIFSINLSSNSIKTKGFSGYIKDKITQYEINTNMICFEINESTAIINLQETQSLIKELKDIGCLFSLDDFGNGLSSFGYLRNLPVDYLKIDGRFVRDMVGNKINHAMVAAVNQIGHVMGIETIAIFVENNEIIEQLKQVGIDYAQGHHISRPIPLADLVKMDIINDSLSDSA